MGEYLCAELQSFRFIRGSFGILTLATPIHVRTHVSADYRLTYQCAVFNRDAGCERFISRLHSSLNIEKSTFHGLQVVARNHALRSVQSFKLYRDVLS